MPDISKYSEFAVYLGPGYEPAPALYGISTYDHGQFKGQRAYNWLGAWEDFEGKVEVGASCPDMRPPKPYASPSYYSEVEDDGW